MQPRVTAILVSRNGGHYLERTLKSLAAQSRRPDSFIFVDAGSTDDTAERLAQSAPAQFIQADQPRSFGAAVAHAISVAAPGDGDDEWLWLLAHDNAPLPGALAALLAAVEIAPSVAVAGPKLMRWDDPDVIASYGETVTRLGAAIALVEGELDQAQHDRRSDLLAVAASGMLVRKSVWAALGGFDPALPSVDAALDFSIRVRLAGHRIVGVPSARVLSDGGPETFGREPSIGVVARLTRAAQLHRRLTYAPALAVPLHWLSILPLAILRAAWQLLAKRPGAITGEFGAALAAIVDTRVAASRRNFSRSRSLGWGAIAPLRMPWAEVRELRAHQRDIASPEVLDDTVRIRPSFLSGGGAWIVILLAGIGLIAFGSLIGAGALDGGALSPLSARVSDLWANVGYGWRSVGDGFVGAADPFAAVLAVIGSVTFWAPSFGIVLLYLLAFPLAGLAAWWCAARLSERGWAPAVAAIAWALAPPFLSSLSTGHLGAVIAHLLLPWLVLAFINASRSWAASAAASILFAAVAASAPSLIPVLVIAWLAWLITHPRRAHRLMGIPVPAVVLFVPLVIDQIARGNWLGIVADPGVPFAAGTASGWNLALGSPTGENAWTAVTTGLGLPDIAASLVIAVLLVPLVLLAVLALYSRGSGRALPALVIGLAGFATAVAAAQLSVTVVESSTVSLWPGAGLSVYWLGFTGAAVVALSAIKRPAALVTVIASVATIALAAPAIVGFATGTADVAASNGRLLPAFVTAEALTDPDQGTLVMSAQSGGGLAVDLERGAGITLDDRSTLVSTSTEVTDIDARVATLAANLASRSGFDSASELQALHIGFILLDDSAIDDRLATIQRAEEALDSNANLVPVGATSSGLLWHYDALTDSPAIDTLTSPQKAIALAVHIVFAIVFGAVLLLAIPTSRRRRSRLAVASDDPATTFDEEEND
jgi:GT2 family glycosyltransferase